MRRTGAVVREIAVRSGAEPHRTRAPLALAAERGPVAATVMAEAAEIGDPAGDRPAVLTRLVSVAAANRETQ